MIKEQWRMHSELYPKKYFLIFPLILLTISFSLGYLTTELNLLKVQLQELITIIAFVIGLSAAFIFIKSEDASKNLLGQYKLILNTYKELPVSQNKVKAYFLISEFLYYNIWFLIPLLLGGLLFQQITIITYFLILTAFITGFIITSILLSISVKIPKIITYQYKKKSRLPALVKKSYADLLRSAGGIGKVVFSFLILTFIFWFLTNYFQLTSVLPNYLVIYGILLGLISITTYNWINLYDNTEHYKALPITKKQILKSKQELFLIINTLIGFNFILAMYLVFEGEFLMTLISYIAFLMLNLGIISKLTGLQPNEKIYNAKIFLEYAIILNLFLISTVVIMLLETVYSISYIFIILFTALAGLIMMRSSLLKLDQNT